MTVADLIELLQMFPPTATVTALNELIIGACYSRGELELQLDNFEVVDLLPPDARVVPPWRVH